MLRTAMIPDKAYTVFRLRQSPLEPGSYSLAGPPMHQNSVSHERFESPGVPGLFPVLVLFLWLQLDASRVKAAGSDGSPEVNSTAILILYKPFIIK
jgi:hypothetical protein